jgi:aspartyl-tRNA(Asn)/glutamyl-tRNA(Gln) amidotransferase subunit A
VTTPYSELCALEVRDLARLYRARELSPVDVVRATIERIERLNPMLNAYIAVLGESAMAAARAAEAQLAGGIDLGPLHGVPVSIKDIINVLGTRTTAASRVLLDAPLDAEDATVVRRLRAAGAIVVGKVNLHEFAFGDPDPDGPFVPAASSRSSHVRSFQVVHHQTQEGRGRREARRGVHAHHA